MATLTAQNFDNNFMQLVRAIDCEKYLHSRSVEREWVKEPGQNCIKLSKIWSVYKWIN